MRHAAAGRRSRNRGNARRGNQNRTQVFDSNGPDVRIRGTAHQILEKYQALAKDAGSSGDYILAESYAQHAEHYQRIITGWQDAVQDYERGIIREEQPAPREEARGNGKERTEAQSGDNEDLGLPASITGAGDKTGAPARADKELADA